MTGWGGFGESGPDSPSLNGDFVGGRKPQNGGFWTPPLFSKIGGGKKRVKKSLRPTSDLRLSVYGIGRGEKSGGGGAMVPRVVPVGGVPPPPVSKIDGIYSRA